MVKQRRRIYFRAVSRKQHAMFLHCDRAERSEGSPRELWSLRVNQIAMRRPVSHGMRYAPNVRRARSTMKRRPAIQKISTMRTSAENIFQGRLTVGLDLGGRSSAYCVLNEAGEIVLEHKLATTPEAMKQVFGSMPRCRIAMERGTHSPWVSRLLAALGRDCRPLRQCLCPSLPPLWLCLCRCPHRPCRRPCQGWCQLSASCSAAWTASGQSPDPDVDLRGARRRAGPEERRRTPPQKSRRITA